MTPVNALGPNNTPSALTGVNASSMNDAHIASLTSSLQFDVCVIEFDITTRSKQISFNYVLRLYTKEFKRP